MRDNDQGVTLVELVMVMILIGIMAGIVAPLLRPQRFQLDAAAVLVASTLTAQQRNSVLRQHNVVIAVDSANALMRVHYDLDNDGTVDAGEPTHVVQLEDGTNFGRGIAPARPLGGTSVSLAGMQGSLPALIFRRNGSASEEAIFYVTSERARVAADYAEDARAVEIERATGRVRCYSYSTGVWLQTC